MKNEKYNDADFESMLEKAVTENFNQKLTKHSDMELAEEYSFSARHEARMQKLFRKEKSRRALRTAAVVAKRTAAAFLMLAVVSTGVIMLDAHVGPLIMHAIMETHAEPKIMTITSAISEEEDAVLFMRQGALPDYSTKWGASYLPENFTVSGNHPGFIVYTTSDIGMSVSLNYIPIPDRSLFGIGGRQVEGICINGEDAFLLTPTPASDDPDVILFWQKSGFTFFLASQHLSIEEMIKIAESVTTV